MSEYSAFARTNAFAVKDLQAFRARAADFDLGYEIVGLEDDRRLVCMHGRDADAGGWPSENFDGERFDILDFIAEHLAPGAYATVYEASGSNREFSASSTILTAEGGEVTVKLDDVMDAAIVKLGIAPERLTYPAESGTTRVFHGGMSALPLISKLEAESVHAALVEMLGASKADGIAVNAMLPKIARHMQAQIEASKSDLLKSALKAALVD